MMLIRVVDVVVSTQDTTLANVWLLVPFAEHFPVPLPVFFCPKVLAAPSEGRVLPTFLQRHCQLPRYFYGLAVRLTELYMTDSTHTRLQRRSELGLFVSCALESIRLAQFKKLFDLRQHAIARHTAAREVEHLQRNTVQCLVADKREMPNRLAALCSIHEHAR